MTVRNLMKSYGGYSRGSFKKHMDAGEMVAEAWSEYKNNPNPRPLDEKIGEEIVRLWKNK